MMSTVQTETEPQDPPTPLPGATATRGKTTYKVFADSGVIAAVNDWIDEKTPFDEGTPSVVSPDALPSCIDGDDLIYLGTYDAPNRDGAVEAMLADERPVDRVKLVQAVHAAHIDLHFPVAPVSYLAPVPVVWEFNPTRKIGR